VSGATSYSGTAGTIIFSAGSATAVLLLDPTADSTVELDENVLLTLLSGAGYTLGAGSSASATITNDDAATITIGDVSVTEGNSGTKTLTFTVTLDKAVDAGVSLNYTTSDVTALAGSDYVAKSGSLSFTGLAGETRTVSVTVNGDTTVELDETFELVLSAIAASGRNVTFSRSRGTGTITNDDAASVSIADVSIAEGNSGTKTVSFTVTFSAAVDAGVSAHYATVDGTALAGSDYTSASGTLAFAGGVGETKTISVTILGDTALEVDEAFDMLLSGLAASGRNVSFSRSRATGTLLNDDAAPLAPTGIAATIARADDVRLNWTASTGATGYQIWRNTVNSPPATPLAVGVTDTSYIDATAQPGTRYYYFIRAVNLSGTSAFSTSATGYVLPTVTLSNVSAGLHEDAAGSLIYTFTRTGSTAEMLTISYNVTGTAVYGSDYTAVGTANFGVSSGTLTFAAGSSTATLGIDPKSDNLVERDETVALSLTVASTYAIGANGSASSVILNDDTATLSVSDAAVTEGQSGTSMITFSITLDRDVETGVDVNYSTANGTALAGSDYVAASGTLSFAGTAGETKTVSIVVNGDSLVETNETFKLVLNSPTASGRAVSLGRAQGTGTITNDDIGDPVGLVVAPNAGLEPLIKVYDSTGDTLRFQFDAYSPAFTLGVRVALGDVNGDGVSDIVVAPVSGIAPIRVFDGTTGAMFRWFFPYSPEFTGGLSIAVGDANGDGKAEIFAGLASKGGAIRVFDGATGNILGAYYAYSPNFLGGLNIAAGDVDGDGRAEVIASPASGAGPAVRVFDAVTGRIRSAYYVYASSFLGGVNVAAGDVDGDGQDEVIASPASLAGPPVSIIDALTGNVRKSFFAFSPNFAGGVAVAAGDLNGDGRAEIIAAPASGWQSVVRVFDGTSTAILKFSQPFPNSFAGGTFLAGKTSSTQSLHLTAVSASASVPQVSNLTLSDAKAVATSVSTRFAASGATAEMLAKLASLEIIITDLPGTSLGLARKGAVILDVNAGGLGWFVDRTPNIDEEFSLGSNGVVRATAAAPLGPVDLLTVLAHELAHQLGFHDLPLGTGNNSLMSLMLPPSVRRATDDQISALFADGSLSEGLLAGSKA
jgi:hypothetical protein